MGGGSTQGSAPPTKFFGGDSIHEDRGREGKKKKGNEVTEKTRKILLLEIKVNTWGANS